MTSLIAILIVPELGNRKGNNIILDSMYVSLFKNHDICIIPDGNKPTRILDKGKLRMLPKNIELIPEQVPFLELHLLIHLSKYDPQQLVRIGCTPEEYYYELKKIAFFSNGYPYDRDNDVVMLPRII